MIRELGSELVRRILRAFLSMHTYSLKNGWIRRLLFYMSFVTNLPVSLLNGARFLQLVLDSSQARRKMLYEVILPTELKAQVYFSVIV